MPKLKQQRRSSLRTQDDLYYKNGDGMAVQRDDHSMAACPRSYQALPVISARVPHSGRGSRSAVFVTRAPCSSRSCNRETDHITLEQKSGARPSTTGRFPGPASSLMNRTGRPPVPESVASCHQLQGGNVEKRTPPCFCRFSGGIRHFSSPVAVAARGSCVDPR